VTCLYNNHNATQLKARGLCHKHYVLVRYHIKLTHTTWKQLEEEGKARPYLGSQSGWPKHAGKTKQFQTTTGRAAGRVGGTSLYNQNGREYMSQLGKKGARVKWSRWKREREEPKIAPSLLAEVFQGGGFLPPTIDPEWIPDHQE